MLERLQFCQLFNKVKNKRNDSVIDSSDSASHSDSTIQRSSVSLSSEQSTFDAVPADKSISQSSFFPSVTINNLFSLIQKLKKN